MSPAARLRRRVTAAGWLDPVALRIALPPFVVGKLATLLIPMLGVFATSQTPTRPTRDELLGPFGYWDGQNYMEIAAHGYPAGPLDLTPGHPGHLWGFFPGYPILIHVAAVFTRDVLTAGMLVSAVAELAALYFLAQLLVGERDEDAGRFGTWLLVLYPYAVYLTAVYTESLFLAAVTASLVAIRRGRTGGASLAAALAVAVRPTGLALIPALLVEHLRRRRWRPGPETLLILGAAVPLGLFALAAYRQTGDLLAYPHVEQSASYNKSLAWPWTSALATWHDATGGNTSSYTTIFLLELVFAVAGLVAVVGSWLSPRIPRSFAVYVSGIWLLATCVSFWLSTPRYMMAMLPVAALLLHDLTRGRPQARLALLAGSAALMGYGAEFFATGRFFG